MRTSGLADGQRPLDVTATAAARSATPTHAEAQRLADLLAMVADPVRSRVLVALGAVPELSVGDLALALDVSADAASYALKMLRTAGLVSHRKDGRVVYYRLTEGFPHALVQHCLFELLAISAGPSTHRARRRR